MFKKLLGALCVLVLCVYVTGCAATGYQSLGLTGGYWERKGPGELIKVVFDGNIRVTIQQLEIYLLFRSAELTRLNHKSYFLMYASIDDAIAGRSLQRPQVGGFSGYVYILYEDHPTPGSMSAKNVIEKYKSYVGGGGGGP